MEERLQNIDTIFSMAMEEKIPKTDDVTAWAYNAASYFKNEYLIFKKEQEERAKKLTEKYPSKAPKPRDFR